VHVVVSAFGVYRVYPVGYEGQLQEPSFTGLMSAHYMGTAHYDCQNAFNVMAANDNYFEGLTIRNTDVAFRAGIKNIAGPSGFTIKHSRESGHSGL
jgi:hypothetical protein